MGRKGVEPLKLEIRRLAEEEAKKILDEAKRKANSIIEEAKRKAEEILRRRTEQALKEARREIELKMASARIKHKVDLIRLRQEYTEKAFSEALNRIRTLVDENREEYEKIFIKLALDAISKLEDYDEYVLIVREKDLDIARRALGTIEEEASRIKRRNVKITIGEERIECVGGMIVCTGNRRVYYNNTVEARIDYVKKVMLDKVHEILFREVRT
ncbi:MAG: hypothetical protein DRN15_06545 [Thermoprotei archaeon]|nr:MAG: hypothetical protein DRM97_06715 [Thermoprotei archaeon]RLF23362.1 MAG: hypothetical protein DRN15_06545 [Thermoprotei archaeon]